MCKFGGGDAKPSAAESRTERELQRARDVRVTQPATTSGPIKKATDDFLMDIGIKPKTTDYYARLPERKAASMAATEQMMKDTMDNDKPAPAPEKPAEPVAETPTEPAAPPPTPVETAQAEVELRVDDLVKDPGQRAAEERARGTPEMDVGTAAGAQAERAAVIADTQAEQEAADALLKGRRSTILTTPGGLLAPAEEEGKTTRRKSLLGG